jgi:hypothetical protein
LAFCLALLTRKSPDLALLVERWDALPEVVRAGIVAMVKVTEPRQETGRWGGGSDCGEVSARDR